MSWDPESRVFDWGRGRVTLPEGFEYQRLRGIDTLIGRFVTRDGRITIGHDIGELSSEHGSGMGGREVVVKGFRVRTGSTMYKDEEGKTEWYFNLFFPDSGCAHFYLSSTDKADRVAMKAIEASFRPTASWWSGHRSAPSFQSCCGRTAGIGLRLPTGF